MSSEASSEQQCVREGPGCDEVFLSGQDDPDTSYDEMVQFANLPSTKENEDLDVDELEGDSNDYYLDDEHPPHSIHHRP